MINKVAFTGKFQPIEQSALKAINIVKASTILPELKPTAKMAEPLKAVYVSPFTPVAENTVKSAGPVINRTGLDFFA